MISPPLTRVKNRKSAVSVWHTDIGVLLGARGAKVPPGELAVFCSKLAFLLGAGVIVQDALPVLGVQGRVLRRAVPEVHTLILQGESLAGAMAAVGVFPVFMRGFVALGERTARLAEVFEQLAAHYEAQARARGELAAVFVYPAAVSVMMLGVIGVAVAVVLPGYADMFGASQVALPGLTRGLLAVAEFVTARGALLGAGLLGAVFFVLAFSRGRAGRAFFSWAQLCFSLYRREVNLRLVQALALMLKAGQPLSAIVPLCAEMFPNARVKGDLARLGNALAAGRPFWAALEEIRYIEPMLVNMARVGEETGRPAQTMARCAAHFEENYRAALRRVNKLVEPLITLVLGVLLAVVMLAIVLPTFELATAV